VNPIKNLEPKGKLVIDGLEENRTMRDRCRYCTNDFEKGRLRKRKGRKVYTLPNENL